MVLFLVAIMKEVVRCVNPFLLREAIAEIMCVMTIEFLRLMVLLMKVTMGIIIGKEMYVLMGIMGSVILETIIGAHGIMNITKAVMESTCWINLNGGVIIFLITRMTGKNIGCDVQILQETTTIGTEG